MWVRRIVSHGNHIPSSYVLIMDVQQVKNYLSSVNVCSVPHYYYIFWYARFAYDLTLMIGT